MFDQELNKKPVGEDREVSGNSYEHRWYPDMHPPTELKAQVERIASKNGCSVRAVIWQLMRAGLNGFKQGNRRSPLNTVTIGLFLDRGVHAELVEHARTSRRSVEDLIRGAVSDFLAKNKAPMKAAA